MNQSELLAIAPFLLNLILPGNTGSSPIAVPGTDSELQMAGFRDMGRMCLNGEIQGVCQNCLWLEWNPQLKKCLNSNTCFCPRRQEEELLGSDAEASLLSA